MGTNLFRAVVGAELVGGPPPEHLVESHPQRPPVHPAVVPVHPAQAALVALRGYVGPRAGEGGGQFVRFQEGGQVQVRQVGVS